MFRAINIKAPAVTNVSCVTVIPKTDTKGLIKISSLTLSYTKVEIESELRK
jgi:hypothetical protein